MNKLSDIGLKRKAELHPDLQLMLEYLLKYMDYTIVTGYRSPEEQLEKYNKGLSQLKVSKHNSIPSMAVDIQPYPLEMGGKKTVREQFYYLTGFAVGIGKMLLEMGLVTHDFRHGGDWNEDGKITDNKFDDLYHIELVEINK